jgi:hypothetical protein
VFVGVRAVTGGHTAERAGTAPGSLSVGPTRPVPDANPPGAGRVLLLSELRFGRVDARAADGPRQAPGRA